MARKPRAFQRRKFWQMACIARDEKPQNSSTYYTAAAHLAAKRQNAQWLRDGVNLEMIVMEAIILPSAGKPSR